MFSVLQTKCAAATFDGNLLNPRGWFNDIVRIISRLRLPNMKLNSCHNSYIANWGLMLTVRHITSSGTSSQFIKFRHKKWIGTITVVTNNMLWVWSGLFLHYYLLRQYGQEIILLLVPTSSSGFWPRKFLFDACPSRHTYWAVQCQQGST